MATSACALSTSSELAEAFTAEQELETLTQESIAVRAYELWQERGCPDGSPEVDWFAAEEELLNS
jgi:Protein of unknown function (DUF2934)